MNNQFNTNYLALLRIQVDQEIDFLVRNGHMNEKIHIPCSFCIDSQKGHYRCNRLNQLIEFQSQILMQQKSLIPNNPGKTKLKIGQLEGAVDQESVLEMNVESHELPLLSLLI